MYGIPSSVCRGYRAEEIDTLKDLGVEFILNFVVRPFRDH